MLPDSLYSEPGLPEPASQVRGFWPAVTVSALLHLAVGIALVRLEPESSQPADAVGDTPSVVIRIAPSSPQRRAETPAAAANAAQEAEIAELPDLAPPVNATVVVTVPAGTTPTVATDETPTQDPGIALDIATLQNSISSHMQVYRRDVLNQDLQECQQYRERYERWDCPQEEELKSAARERIDENFDTTFRAYTYGHDANARISRELLADMDAMRPLMEDEGVLGTLARERYYLKELEYKYLNPGGYQGGFAPIVNTGGVVGLASINLGGIDILNGLLTLSFKDGKVDVMNKGPAKPFDEDDE
jgi:hypothetical protein